MVFSSNVVIVSEWRFDDATTSEINTMYREPTVPNPAWLSLAHCFPHGSWNEWPGRVSQALFPHMCSFHRDCQCGSCHSAHSTNAIAYHECMLRTCDVWSRCADSAARCGDPRTTLEVARWCGFPRAEWSSQGASGCARSGVTQ